jgi:hypothetical protein
MNTSDVEIGTRKDAQKAFEYLERPEVEKMFAKADEDEKRDRELYLEHPDRKTFFSYDFVEAFWMHFRDYYHVSVGDAEMQELIDSLADDRRMYEMVYDLSQNLAEKRGWEMK